MAAIYHEFFIFFSNFSHFPLFFAPGFAPFSRPEFPRFSPSSPPAVDPNDFFAVANISKPLGSCYRPFYADRSATSSRQQTVRTDSESANARDFRVNFDDSYRIRTANLRGRKDP